MARFEIMPISNALALLNDKHDKSVLKTRARISKIAARPDVGIPMPHGETQFEPKTHGLRVQLPVGAKPCDADALFISDYGDKRTYASWTLPMVGQFKRGWKVEELREQLEDQERRRGRRLQELTQAEWVALDYQQRADRRKIIDSQKDRLLPPELAEIAARVRVRQENSTLFAKTHRTSSAPNPDYHATVMVGKSPQAMKSSRGALEKRQTQLHVVKPATEVGFTIEQQQQAEVNILRSIAGIREPISAVELYVRISLASDLTEAQQLALFNRAFGGAAKKNLLESVTFGTNTIPKYQISKQGREVLEAKQPVISDHITA